MSSQRPAFFWFYIQRTRESRITEGAPMPQNARPSTKRTRQYWGRTGVTLPELDLTKVQRESYEEFLATGIRESLDEINAERGIEDFTGKNWSLKFGEYHL